MQTPDDEEKAILVKLAKLAATPLPDPGGGPDHPSLLEMARAQAGESWSFTESEARAWREYYPKLSAQLAAVRDRCDKANADLAAARAEEGK